MSQAKKCQVLTKSQTLCSRNAIDGQKYCKQHSKIYQSTEEPKQMKLIPDLQNIVNQYLTPYDHYQLIDKIKDKFYTLPKYLERQQEYELKVSRSIYEDYKSEMDFGLIQNQDLVRNDPVCDELKVFIFNPGAGDYELNQKRNIFVKKYTQWDTRNFQ